MQTGRLRHLIIIQQPTYTKNAMGEKITTWIPWQTVWANIKPDTGSTKYSAKQMNAEATGHIEMRYLAGVKPVMRAVKGAQIFNFLSIINVDERNRQLLIPYKEQLD